jgi:tetratricopeptide (TPR) repeat protein
MSAGSPTDDAREAERLREAIRAKRLRIAVLSVEVISTDPAGPKARLTGIARTCIEARLAEDCVDQLGYRVENLLDRPPVTEEGERFRDLFDRANWLTYWGRIAEAESLIDEAIALRPNAARGHILRARFLAELERCDEAVQAAERAVALSPSDAYTETLRELRENADARRGRPGSA